LVAGCSIEAEPPTQFHIAGNMFGEQRDIEFTAFTPPFCRESDVKARNFKAKLGEAQGR
jgi:hypothetical protein